MSSMDYAHLLPLNEQNATPSFTNNPTAALPRLLPLRTHLRRICSHGRRLRLDHLALPCASKITPARVGRLG